MTRVVAWVLLAATVVLTGAFFLVTEEPTSYRDLRAAVADREVDEVVVDGPTSPYRGEVTVQVRWRSGPFGAIRHVATVTEQHPLRDRPWRRRIVVEDVGEDLTALDPDVVVSREQDVLGDSSFSAFGRPVPGWFVAVAAAVGLWTFLLLITGDPPWRATRWAWFWLMGMAPPVGIVLFLLLSGRTGCLPPRRPEGKLTGGWAFLIAFAVNSVTQTLVNVV